MNVSPSMPEDNTVSSDFSTAPPSISARQQDLAIGKARLSARRILVGDSSDWHIGTWFAAQATLIPGGGGDLRHRGSNNHLFFDGHVATLPAAVAGWAVADPARLP